MLCSAVSVLRILAELRSGDSMSETPNRSVEVYRVTSFLVGGLRLALLSHFARESLLRTSIIPALTGVLDAFTLPRSTQLHLNTVSVSAAAVAAAVAAAAAAAVECQLTHPTSERTFLRGTVGAEPRRRRLRRSVQGDASVHKAVNSSSRRHFAAGP